MRSAKVAKAGGVPYTPRLQQSRQIYRNEARKKETMPGKSMMPSNSLVSLMMLSPLKLTAKMQDLGFLKDYMKCPKCGGKISRLRSLAGAWMPCDR